jgi:hypothetical protein
MTVSRTLYISLPVGYRTADENKSLLPADPRGTPKLIRSLLRAGTILRNEDPETKRPTAASTRPKDEDQNAPQAQCPADTTPFSTLT